MMPRSLPLLTLCALILAGEPDLHRERVAVPTWGDEPEVIVSSTRAEVCLNGLWRFLPATGLDAPAQDAAWRQIRVPGSWVGTWPLDPRPGVVLDDERGDPGQLVALAWYERPLRLPAGWNGRRITLDLDRVSTDAEVWLDEQRCGRVAWPAGSVELAGARPGATQRLRVLVAASRSAAGAARILENGRSPIPAENLDARGLIGDTWLRSAPAGGRIDDLVVATSVRRGEITVGFTCAGTQPRGAVTVTLTVSNQQGRELRRFPAQTATGERLAATWAWPEAPRWDLDDARLLRAQVTVQADGFADSTSTSFGFRECWIDGDQLRLNGSVLRLRAVSSNEGAGVDGLIDAAIAGARAVGFNAAQLWPFDHDERGRWHQRGRYAARADALGWGVIGPVLMPTPAMLDAEDQAFEAAFADWNTRMRRELAVFRGHPSILLWSLAGITYHDDNQNPARIGSRERGLEATDAAYQRRFARTQRCVEAVRAADPTRPVLVHNGAPAGDIYGANIYLGLLPAAEQAAWMDRARGGLPVFVPELGLPLWAAGMRGREGYPSASVSEPLLTEHAAGWIGPEAYALETPAYRAAIASHFVRGQDYRDFHNQLAVTKAPTFGRLGYGLVLEVLRAWRSAGITGFIPWEDGDGWARLPMKEWNWRDAPAFVPGSPGAWLPRWPERLARWMATGGDAVTGSGVALQQALRPTLAWIAGPPAAPHLGVHHATAGQAWARSVVLINDTRHDQPISGSWTISHNGAVIARQELSGSLATGAIRRDPLPVPALPAGAGSLDLNVRIGADTHRETCGFIVVAPPTGLRARIWDPARRSQATLEAARISDDPASRLLVVGEKALSDGHTPPSDLGSFVNDGGRLVILAQDPEWMRRTWGLRVGRQVERRTWPLTNPVMQGLNAWDLRDWTGSGGLLPAIEAPFTGFAKGFRDFPVWGWRWGTQGSVCSAAIEVPHRAGWTPLAVTGFDLAYSPLLELDLGRGRAWLCTFDVRHEDPVSLQLLNRLLRHATESAAIPRRSVHYLGGTAWRERLGHLGLSLSDGPAAPGSLLLLGDGNLDAAAVEAHVRGGGTAVLLARSAPALGFTYRTARDAGSLAIPAWPETRGLAPGDLRLRGERDGSVIAGGGEVACDGYLARRRLGTGLLLACQIDPDRLDADTTTWLRLSRWRQTRALCQILANLGASFPGDAAPLGLMPTADLYHADWRGDHRLGDDPARYSKY
jgi:beta-galactosidase